MATDASRRKYYHLLRTQYAGRLPQILPLERPLLSTSHLLFLNPHRMSPSQYKVSDRIKVLRFKTIDNELQKVLLCTLIRAL